MTDIGSITGKITLTDDYSAQLSRFGSSITAVGTKMKSVGKTLTIGITAPIIAATAAVTKMGASFDAEMVKINTLVGVDINLVKQWNKEILEMSGTVGRAPKELAEALFVVTSAGERDATRAMNVLNMAAKAAAVGLGDTTEIARTVTAVMQAYGDSGMTAARATDILVATVREGNLEASSLAGSLGRVIGIASQVGVSFEEVGGFIATFTRLGVKSEEAVTALRGVMNSMMKPSQQAEEAIASVGLSFDQLRANIKENGLTATMLDLVGRFKDNKAALAEIIPNVRALSGVMGTAGAQAEAYLEITKNVTDSQGMLDEAFRVTRESISQQFKEVWASLKSTMTKIGLAIAPVIQNQVIPLLKSLMEWLGKTADAFMELPEPAKAAALALTLVAAAIPPMLVGGGTILTMLPHMAKGFSMVASSLGILNVTTTKAIPNVATLGMTMTKVPPITLAAGKAFTTASSMASGFGSVITGGLGLAALKVGLAGVIGFQIGKWFNSLAIEARGGADAVDKAVERVGMFRAGLSLLPDIAKGIWNVFKTTWETIGLLAKQAFETIGQKVVAVWSVIKEKLGPIGVWLGDIFSKIGEKLSKVFSSISEAVTKVWNVIKEKIGGVGEIVSGFQGLIEENWKKIFGLGVEQASGVATWTNEQRKAFEDFKKSQEEAGAASQKMAEQVTGSVDKTGKAMAGMSKDAQKAEEAAKKAKEAHIARMKALEDTIQEMIDQTKQGLTTQMEDLSLSIGELLNRGLTPSVAQTLEWAEAAREFEKEGVKLTALLKEIKKDAIALGDIPEEILKPEILLPSKEELSRITSPSSTWKFPQLPPMKIDTSYIAGMDDFVGPLQQSEEAITAELEKQKEAQDEFNRKLQVANDFAQLFGGTAGSIVGQITAMGASLKKLSVMGKGSIFGGIKASWAEGKGDATGVTGFIGGLSGILPAIGAIAGPAIGAIKGLATKLFGRGGPFGKASIASIVENEMGVGISEGLANSIEQSGQNVQLALGQIFREGKMTVDQLAEEMGDIFAGLSRGEFTKPEAIRALEETVPMLIENFGSLGTEGEAQVQRIIAAAQTMGVEFTGLSDLISTSMGPSVQDVANQFDLTNQQARELADTLGVKLPTDTQKLAAQLGTTPAIIRDIGAALEKDFGMGIKDIEGLLDTMDISIEDLAKSLGVKIPAGMKGAAGSTDPVVSGIDRVVDRLETLIQGMGIDLPNAMAGATGRVTSDLDKIISTRGSAGLSQVADATMQLAKYWGSDFAQGMTASIKAATTGMGGFETTAKNALRNIKDAARDAARAVGDVGDIPDAGGGKRKRKRKRSPETMQHGGIADRPTLTWIAEGGGGPEVVAPVRALFGELGHNMARTIIKETGGRQGGGGGGAIVNINGGVYLASAEEIADYLAESVGIILRDNRGGATTEASEGLERIETV